MNNWAPDANERIEAVLREVYSGVVTGWVLVLDAIVPAEPDEEDGRFAWTHRDDQSTPLTIGLLHAALASTTKRLIDEE